MTNPLIAAYRKPALFVTLPSSGKYYDTMPKLSVDGELAIYPMTARDELIYKTPDALFNGEATHAVIASCAPDIKDPDTMPVNDLVVILLAIRQATYGKELNIDIKCPECEALNMMKIDATALLATATPIDEADRIEWDNGFIINLKPYNLRDRTLLQIQQVKQRKMLQALTDENINEEDRTKLFGQTFVELAELTVDLISNSIRAVRPPEGEEITDDAMIKEWLQTITKDDYDSLKDKVESLSKDTLDTDNLSAQCQECNHEWKTKVDLDVANFFVG
jgi:phage FluMu protein Com